MRDIHLLFVGWFVFILGLAYLVQPNHTLDVECYQEGKLVYKTVASRLTTWGEVFWITEAETGDEVKLTDLGCIITKVTEKN